jgi:cobalamin biosynthesis protein CbiD
MEEPPEQYNICASCGTEFGVHDVNASIEELRVAWLKTGLKWFSAVDPEPQDWNPYIQVRRAIEAQGSFSRTSIRSDAGNDPDPISGVAAVAVVSPFSDIEHEVVFV